MLFAAVMLYQQYEVGFAGVILPVLALMSSFGPVVALAGLGSTLQNTFAAGNRVLDILDEKPVTEDITGYGNIDFAGAKAEDVSFAYGDETILQNVSVEIPQKQIIGLIGRSGSGKSTLLKLFMRFWKTNQGQILLSDHNINEINTDNLRNMESFMTQETHLFHDSIANNLRIARLDATQEELEAACRKASIHEFIMSLPNGYETDIGQRGIKLSGGQKQRLSIARVFLKNPPILIFDEATSALDNESEKVVQDSLEKLAKNRTTFVIAHRLSTIKNAEKIIVLSEDGIEESGTHEELMDRKGTYEKLYNMQFHK